jgi:hypothetical protein
MAIIRDDAGTRERAPGGPDGLFEYDLQSLPLLRILSPHVADFGSVDVPSFFAAVDAGFAHEVPFAVLHDARGLPPVSRAARVLFVEMVNERRPLLTQRVAAYAAVVGSPFERGIVTAISWFSNPPLPVRLFERLDYAEAWLTQRLFALEGGAGVPRVRQV